MRVPARANERKPFSFKCFCQRALNFSCTAHQENKNSDGSDGRPGVSGSGKPKYFIRPSTCRALKVTRTHEVTSLIFKAATPQTKCWSEAGSHPVKEVSMSETSPLILVQFLKDSMLEALTAIVLIRAPTPTPSQAGGRGRLCWVICLIFTSVSLSL